MIADTIAALIGNYMTTLFVVGLIVAAIKVLRYRGHRDASYVSGTFLNSYLVWGVGVAYAVNFVMHSVFGDYAAKTIGWAQSPFQLELAFTSLGVAVIAFVASRRTAQLSSKAALIVATAVFGFGAAGGHIYQIVANGDDAVNNTGLLLASDIGINLIGLVLLLWHAAARGREQSVTDAPGSTAGTVAV